MTYEIKQGDCLDVLKTLESESVQMCVTSPPYFGLRNYNVDGQIGLEATPALFVAKMVEVFEEVRRVLKPDGTLWLNLGDSYNAARDGGHAGGSKQSSLARHGGITRSGANVPGLKPKDLIGIPWRVAFALQEAGWWLRQDIIWSKPNPMPESVTDRCTKAHEYLFLLTKSAKYFYDNEAIKEPSVTDDMRRPYGSEGAWALDGRPDEQKHGGELRNSWKGSEFHTGKTATHQLGRSSTNRDRSLPRNRNGITGSLDRKPLELGEKGKQADATTDRRSAGARMGRGAGWRDDPENYVTSRNKRSVWTVATQPYSEAHFATFPPKLIEPCVLAGSREGDMILDPFAGAGTSLLVALQHNRRAIGIELNPEYIELSEKRLSEIQVNLFS